MAHVRYRRLILWIFLLLLASGLLAASAGYRQKGLVTEKYSPDFYRVPKLLPDDPIEKNPQFIVYGDSQPGWRIKEKFIRRENWLSWKMLIFPFYEIYWLGNGVIGGIDWLRRVPDYGYRERQIIQNAIYAQAAQSGVDFILHVGDMTDDGRRPTDWAMFLRENKEDLPLVSDFPFLPAVGNHEKANDLTYGLPNYEAVFEYPQFYALDFPDVAIFVVDSNLILDQYESIDDDRQDALFREWFVSEEGSERLSWLERELASRNQRFKIVAMHHPPVSFGKHHKDWAEPDWGRNLPQKRQQLLKLLCEQRVQMVLCGHEHIYEHSIIRYSARADRPEHQIHVVVSDGGAPIRHGSDAQKVKEFTQNYRAEGLDVVLVKQEEIYHYCLVDVAPDKITIKVLEVTGEPEEPPRLAEEISILR
jgi:predicted phosphohydrolase